jgi:hypothetical protein
MIFSPFFRFKTKKSSHPAGSAKQDGYREMLKLSISLHTHTLNSFDHENPGFNFLGFTIRQFEVGKYQSGKNSQGSILGFKTIIKPSAAAIKSQIENIAATIDAHQAAPQDAALGSVLDFWLDKGCCR